MVVRVLAVLGVSSSNASQSLDHMAPARVFLLDERDDLPPSSHSRVQSAARNHQDLQ